MIHIAQTYSTFLTKSPATIAFLTGVRDSRLPRRRRSTLTCWCSMPNSGVRRRCSKCVAAWYMMRSTRDSEDGLDPQEVFPEAA